MNFLYWLRFHLHAGRAAASGVQLPCAGVFISFKFLSAVSAPLAIASQGLREGKPVILLTLSSFLCMPASLMPQSSLFQSILSKVAP